MSAPSDEPRGPTASAVTSNTLTDLLVSGVMVELDAGMAEDLGAFEETALSEADAWEANADLDAAEAHDGE